MQTEGTPAGACLAERGAQQPGRTPLTGPHGGSAAAAVLRASIVASARSRRRLFLAHAQRHSQQPGLCPGPAVSAPPPHLPPLPPPRFGCAPRQPQVSPSERVAALSGVGLSRMACGRLRRSAATPLGRPLAARPTARCHHVLPCHTALQALPCLPQPLHQHHLTCTPAAAAPSQQPCRSHGWQTSPPSCAASRAAARRSRRRRRARAAGHARRHFPAVQPGLQQPRPQPGHPCGRRRCASGQALPQQQQQQRLAAGGGRLPGEHCYRRRGRRRGSLCRGPPSSHPPPVQQPGQGSGAHGLPAAQHCRQP